MRKPRHHGAKRIALQFPKGKSGQHTKLVNDKLKRLKKGK